MSRLPAAERRSQILDVALERFGRDGYHRTSMNDIAEAAGITKPVVYQHFDSKDELFLAVLRAVGDRLRAMIDETASTADTPHEQVEFGIRSTFAFFAAQPAAYWVLFGEGARLDTSFAEEVSRIEDGLSEHLATLIVMDDLDERERSLLAGAVVGLLEGSLREWMRRDCDGDPGETAAVIAKLAWYGLRGG